jgi:transcriptional regulator
MKLSVEERKKYVLGLHKKGYKDREIAQELRISSRDIVKILKENDREEIEEREREKKDRERLFSSNRSEAV